MKEVAVFTLVAVLSTSALAGGHKMKVKHHEPDYDYLAYKLDLDDSQRAEFKTIMKAKSEKRRAIMESVQEQMKVLRKETEVELSSVLSEEQLAKFKDMRPHKGMRKVIKKEVVMVEEN